MPTPVLIAVGSVILLACIAVVIFTLVRPVRKKDDEK